MSRMARWCFAHRKVVVGAWVLALVVVLALSQATGSNYKTSFNLPNTDSQAALNLLTKNFPAASGESDQVVIEATGGASVRSAEVKSAVTAALSKVAKVPGVANVVSPYSPGGSGQISRDGTIAFATVLWSKGAAQVTTDDAKHLINAAQTANGPHVHISLGGQSIENEEGGGPGVSVAVGVIAALVILLIVFGGALAASVMPLVTAILALIVGTSVISLLSHVMSMPNIASDLAILIGLGVGVDYGLFVISRHRSGIKAGMSYEDAVAQAVNTSGRTVLFAGATVCVALLGQLALGVSLLNGMSIAAAVTVALTMAASLTFLPAMLGFLGSKALSRRERATLAKGTTSDVSGFWLRWARIIEAHTKRVAAGALAIVVVIGIPTLGLRLGTPDASVDSSGSTTHQAYEALSRGFGPGFNGALELAAKAESPAARSAFNRLLSATKQLPGVASVAPAATSPNGKAMLAAVYPRTSPQDKQTVNLVNHIRDSLIPPAERGTGLTVNVGGQTATNIDFAHVLTDKLPIFIGIVVVLAFILLTCVFRSLLIPLVASCMNLLSIAAALGGLTAVFSKGWGSSILGVSATGPISPFLPVLMFSILFGLSMDYEVYLVSRIQEEWHHGAGPASRSRNDQAIITGQAKAGRIIAAAAGIMILVFGSFIVSNNETLKEFGFGLAFSVLVDALVIRSLFIPAIMHLIGPANWAMPAWLDRILPNLSIEAEEQPAAIEPEPDPV